jgi:hypothetical protein
MMGKIRIKNVNGRDIVVPYVDGMSSVEIENVGGFDFKLPLERKELRNVARTLEHIKKRGSC